ncbi:STAS/SEC14 domain-containing protein [Kaistella rhinocerotis]|uniref:STAS/SEC14 domain-containing protein n=1 Tax=Kaistella rhinocerotis TaxID=3026437 RepID=UPI0025555EA7|nr:STAS/SEC14 domain-containing protein [Kaistella sp. Ran72]
MITLIPDVPENVAAFRASGEITKDDFESVVMPHVKAKVNTFDELNYLLLLDTDLDKFTVGAWMQDAFLGLKNLSKWNRAAIVTDKTAVQKFTDGFSAVAPGEFRGYSKDELSQAIAWCAGGNTDNQ